MSDGPIMIEDFAEHCNQLLDQLLRGDATDCMRDCMRIAQTGQSANFTLAQNADGNPWPLRKYHGHPIKDKGRSNYPGHPLLIDTGDLFFSVTSPSGPDHIEDVTDRYFFTGTGIDYAAIHEFGADPIPAREFIAIDQRHQVLIEDRIGQWFVDVWRRA